MAKRFPSQHSRFQDVDSKYREFIDSMLEDSKVLSVLSRYGITFDFAIMSSDISIYDLFRILHRFH